MDAFWEKKYGKIYGQVLLIVTMNQNYTRTTIGKCLYKICLCSNTSALEK